MLQDVAELDMSDAGGYVGVPKQLVVTGDATSIPAAVSEAGLKLPLVAKPLVADGSPKSHAMSLVYDESCLTQLDPPLVLQEFVNHGGVLFKTYVVGDYVRVVRRFSLPDVPEGEMKRNGIMPFPRVSCAAESAEEALAAGILDPQAAELPPRRLLESLSKELRRRLGLQLFNMDIIREGGAGSRYYVIDINYFPGFGKMPEYEKVFTDFLVDLAVNKSKKTSRADSSVC
ncbi:inositol-tetrakisphosphate 1-kinase 3 isoform X2 [Physcomitrium patens]|nr:inositol-tetrakisphosphate 1-kinase 3-like isoform X2 [Physcomitrium patens]|eukprot:XP_024403887.1 inositol-tetrakisphosphate 1-kinase 3-like isoform X2 [Physcomitrella patens]